MQKTPLIPKEVADQVLHRNGQDAEVNVAMNERLISLGVGGALLLNSLIGPRSARPLSLLAAGGLLYRGLTGHCHAYKLLGVDTTQGERVEEAKK